MLGNFVEIVETHEDLLISMESSNDRIGKLFLSKAATMKCVHQAYCAAHPRAIVILDKYSEELENYMERQGAASPGLLVLTTGLSKPFRRLDKYAAMLQELERHMESGHPDRGDTQRSISIYKDIAVSSAAFLNRKMSFHRQLIFVSVCLFGNASTKRVGVASVDWSSSKLARTRVEFARRHHSHGQRCRWSRSSRSLFRAFSTNTFDFERQSKNERLHLRGKNPSLTAVETLFMLFLRRENCR